ncbi:hypothetical protein PNU79_09980 [Turicibacter sanguinis]|uniref:hypothetical protein n=1 Tax=Turicibacter sanguinis TaxID=154288 RepID=UPI00232CC12C|nr:hypothetical protein [Turicibacter sanguinis]MDB8542325.1 hypothetical protein [Turicibacter sanguinis]
MKKQIAKYDVVSFDIFDTAILRYVSMPQDIFRLIENSYKLEGFTELRKQIEKELRLENSKSEISIEQIYVKLTDYYKQSDLMQIEIELEKRLTTVNPDVFDIYQEALNQKKKIIFTSDMYLPYEVIESILFSNGYSSYDKLFVSSVHQTSKHLGGLYQKVKETYPDTKILHFGDNLYSDILMAKKNGITPYYIKRKKVSNSLEFRDVVQKVLKKDITFDSFWERLGYEKVGLAYYGFMRWIISQLEIQKPEKVLFLSRDGFIMHQLYEKMGGELPNEYVYVSRKALSFPLLNTAAEMVEYYLGYDLITYENFFEIISLDITIYTKQLSDLKINSEDLISTELEKEKLVLFLDLVWKDIKILQDVQHTRILNYLKNCVGHVKQLAVIDLGWKGTIQYFLEQYLNEINPEIKVKGYYLGIGTKNPRMKQEYSCYLFDKGKLISDHAKLKYGATIIEHLFSAPHGTVTGYNEQMKPNLKQDNRLNQQFQNLNLIHQGAFKLIEQLISLEDVLSLYQLTPQQATDSMFKMISNPTPEEVRYLSDLYHSDTVDDIVLKKIVDRDKISKCFKNREYKTGVKQIYWPTGYVSYLKGQFILKKMVSLFIKSYTYLAYKREVAK